MKKKIDYVQVYEVEHIKTANLIIEGGKKTESDNENTEEKKTNK